MMVEEKLFGLELDTDNLEVVRRGDRYFVRYDAGAHQNMWREDEISEPDAMSIGSGRPGEYDVIVRLQRRLGLGAYTSNWMPPTMKLQLATVGQELSATSHRLQVCTQQLGL
jgi:hypothetical protein